MKSKILGLAIFALTAATVAFYPVLRASTTAHPPGTLPILPVQPVLLGTPKVDVVFALDTTGSMGGLIQAAKDKIWSIATTMASAQSAPEIRIGLVAYRDRGDAYVTKVVDLSDDLDSVYAKLMDFQANGGGDGPESVNQALHDAIHKVSWSQDPQAYKVVFLVGDAPPHMDYPDDVKYPVSLKAAADMGIVVNSIQCGDLADTVHPWQRIAQLGQGRYFEVEQAGSAVAIATPFDSKIARLSRELDDTRLYYGTEEEQAEMKRKVAATDKLHAYSSVESRARRAAFNASKSGEKNLLGNRELVADFENGRVELEKLDADELPEPLRDLSPQEQKDVIGKAAAKRSRLQAEIKELAQMRQGFLAEKVEEAGGAEDSLDHKIYEAIREQAAAKGLEYNDGPEY